MTDLTFIRGEIAIIWSARSQGCSVAIGDLPMPAKDTDITKTIVRYDSPYAVTAADGQRIPLPMKDRKWVKFPVVVTVTLPFDGNDWYTIIIVPKPYSGFVDKWTDKIVNSDFLVQFASKSLPRSAGYAMLGFGGAIAGALLGTLFTPSDIGKDSKIKRVLDDGVRVVYWVMCEFQDYNPPSGGR